MNTVLLVFILLLHYFMIETGECKMCNNFSRFMKQCVCTISDANKCEDFSSTNYSTKQYEDTVVFTFSNIHFCTNSTHKVELLVDETKNTSSKCIKNSGKVKTFNTHSYQELQDCSVCGEYIKEVNFTFDYVFSGCYLLKIYQLDNLIYNTSPIFIVTKYRKAPIANIFTIIHNNKPAKNETKIEIILESHEITRPINISTRLLQTDCFENCIDLNSTTLIYSNTSNYNLPEFIKCSNFSDVFWYCSYTKDSANYITYVCTFVNLKTGFYTFYFEPLDEFTRCNKNSVWIDKMSCKKKYQFFHSRSHLQTDGPQLETNGHFPAVYVIPPFIIFLLAIISAYMCYKKRCKNEKSKDINDEDAGQELVIKMTTAIKAIKKEEAQIFLIYARDDPRFDDIVTELKNLLSNNSTVPIHDVHNLIFKNIYDLLIEPNTISIVFINNCGLDLLRNPNLRYKLPNDSDKHFNQAVDLLIEKNINKPSNFFVVSLPNCYEDISKTVGLSNGRIYCMPESICELLNFLFGEQYDEQLVERFKENCYAMINFLNENNNYEKDYLGII